MNMFLKEIKTADEAVQFLYDEGILVEDGNKMSCEKIAAHYKEVFDDRDLYNKLSDKDKKDIESIPEGDRKELLMSLKEKGDMHWRMGLLCLPRWGIDIDEFEQALERRFA